MVLKKVVSYYVQRHSLVFFKIFLDATKAFDRLKYCKLVRAGITLLVK